MKPHHTLFGFLLFIILLNTQPVDLSASEDPVVGANDFRISEMGGPGTPFIHPVYDPRIAYDIDNRTYLVIWSGAEADTAKTAIFGRFVDAATGAVEASQIRIAETPASGNNALQGTAGQDVVYNSVHKEYLVVFHGSMRSDSSEIEVFGQRVGPDGSTIGETFRISDMGEDGDPDADVYHDVRVAYNSSDDEYLVVWRGDDVGNHNTPDGHFEVFGQRLGFEQDQLFEKGENDFPISNVQSNGTIATSKVGWPNVVYNAIDNRYLVVWQEDYVGNGAYVIVRKLLDATANQVGDNGLVISDTLDFHGGGAMKPSLCHSNLANEYLVVWTSIQTTSNIFEIFGQFLNENGDESGPDDFQISSNGSASNPSSSPQAIYNPYENLFLISWQGGQGETELFGQFLDATGNRIRESDFRISDLGAEGNPLFYTNAGGDIAYADGLNSYLTVWYGDDDRDGQVDDELEVFGQVIEPVLDIQKKLISDSLTVDSGDTVVYEIQVSHKSTVEGGTLHDVSMTDAFDVSIQDTLQLQISRLIGAEISDGMTATDVRDKFIIDENILATTDTLNLRRGTNGNGRETLSIKVAGFISRDLAPDNLDNIAYMRWKNAFGLEHPAYFDSSSAPTLSIIVGVRETGSPVPDEYDLANAFPNPFNPSTTIQFDLPDQGHVTLKVYNLRGELVQTLVDAFTAAGSHRVQWNGRTRDGKQAPSGVYLIRLEVSTLENDFVRTRRLTLLR